MEVQNEGPENAGTSGEQRANVQNTKAAEWLALAERCGKAIGPDRKIEEVIFVALGRLPYSPWIGDITASLDAITALIERELPGWMLTLTRSQTHGPRAVLVSPDYRKQIGADAHTVQNAACAAFCRAMAGKEDRS